MLFNIFESVWANNNKKKFRIATFNDEEIEESILN